MTNIINNKYIRCVDSKNSRDMLQLHQVYRVIGETSMEYVVDIQGKQVYFRKTRFTEEI